MISFFSAIGVEIILKCVFCALNTVLAISKSSEHVGDLLQRPEKKIGVRIVLILAFLVLSRRDVLNCYEPAAGENFRIFV